MWELMTTEEVAEYLRVSPHTVLSWIKTERYPKDCYFRVGGRNGPYRWRKDRLDHYLLEGSEPEPKPESAEEEAPEQLDMFVEQAVEEPCTEEEPIVGARTTYYEETIDADEDI